jgi:hypothetical protein
MQLTLTDDESTELRDLLDGSLGDLSSEIAATDDPTYRLGLKARRVRLQSVRAQLVGPAGRRDGVLDGFSPPRAVPAGRRGH